MKTFFASYSVFIEVWKVGWIRRGLKYTKLSWIASLSCWIGLDWILQNVPLSYSAFASKRQCRPSVTIV